MNVPLNSMAWLFIDTSQPNVFRMGTLAAGDTRVVSYEGRAHELLPMIARKLSPTKLRQLEGICVVHGPGSFSAVRGGVIAANVLSRVWKLLLVGVSCVEVEELEQLAQDLATKKKSPTGYVTPTYIAEPNITLKKVTLKA